MANSTTESYLPAGLPIPVPSNDGLDTPYWEAAKRHELVVQQCNDCQTYQWGPEWICNNCLSTDFKYTEIAGEGTIYSWERPWHPVHPALRGSGPYIVVLVELPHAGNVRMVGNLLGDAEQEIVIGSAVEVVYEDHEGDEPYTLVQWRVKS
jgi:uncharacterized OB-fold protein